MTTTDKPSSNNNSAIDDLIEKIAIKLDYGSVDGIKEEIWELLMKEKQAAYSKGASDMLEKVAVMREELGQCYQFNPKYSTETKDRMAIENLERVNEVLNAMDELLSQHNNKQGESEKEQ